MQLLGKAIQSLPRDQLVICTKIGKYAPGEAPDYSADKVKSSVKGSLRRLGVDYIDILHCHDIEFCTDMRQIVTETLPALLELKQQRIIRAIGITGYPLDIFQYVLDKVPLGTVDVVLSYCHNSLHDTSLLQLLPYLHSKGVGVISAAPLCMGLWRPQGPESWHPAPDALKRAAKECADLAANNKLSIAELAIKAAIDQAGSGVAVHLMGMARPSEVQQNVAVIRKMMLAGQTAGEERGNAGSVDTMHGFSDSEQQVLQQMREILQPVKDVTWPVGLTDNRK